MVIHGWGTDPASKLPRWSRFYQRLSELGWRDGDNVRLQPRFGARDEAKGDQIRRDFVHTQVAVIVVIGTGEALAAKRATSTMPIVALHMLDPEKLGRMQTLSSVSGKQLELIAQRLPSVRSAVYGRGATGSREHGDKISAAAKWLAITYRQSDLSRDRGFDGWAGQMKREGVDAAVFVLDGLTFPPPHHANLAAALIKHSLPAICGAGGYADEGCWMSCGPLALDHCVRAAQFVDKILRGAKPADIPAEQPTRFERVVHQITAEALGIQGPRAMLLRADRLIE